MTNTSSRKIRFILFLNLFILLGIFFTGCTYRDLYAGYAWKQIPDVYHVFERQDSDVTLVDAVSFSNATGIMQQKYVILGVEKNTYNSGFAIFISNDISNWRRVYWKNFEMPMWRFDAGAIAHLQNRLIVIGILQPKGEETYAVGNYCWYSDDGLNWYSSKIDETYADWQRECNVHTGLYDVAASDECAVAVGNSGHRAIIYKTSDGQNWEQVYLAQDNDCSVINSIYRVNDYFLAFGAFKDGGPAIWKSQDGISWEVNKYPEEINSKFISAALQNDGSGYIFGDKLWRLGSNGSISIFKEQNPFCIATSKPDGYPLMYTTQRPFGDVTDISTWDTEYSEVWRYNKWVANTFLGYFSRWRFTREELTPDIINESAIKGRCVIPIESNDGNFPVRMLVGSETPSYQALQDGARLRGTVWVWGKQ